MSDDTLGIYLSVPFCKAKCTFCNFASGVFGEGRMHTYVDRLCREIESARSAAERVRGALPGRVDSVYFGGGTPSLLEPAHLGQIFAALCRQFDIDTDAEITLEAAPGQIAEATLACALEHGVNRVSFGVQSFVEQELTAIGRLHTSAQCTNEIGRMRSAGVARVSLDLIAGLPHQNSASWAHSLDEAIASGADHVSVYMLEVDEDSRLGREALAGGTRYGAAALPSDDAAADWYQVACERLAAAGLEQYEISNYARPGCGSRHNRKYWSRQPYVGFGMDAHSMLRAKNPDAETVAIRWANPDEMDQYLGAALGPLPIFHSPTIDLIGEGEAFEESLFLGLRMNAGVDLDQLQREFGSARVAAAGPVLEEVERAGLLRRSAQTIQLTPAGRLASNEVFSRLLAA